LEDILLGCLPFGSNLLSCLSLILTLKIIDLNSIILHSKNSRIASKTYYADTQRSTDLPLDYRKKQDIKTLKTKS